MNDIIAQIPLCYANNYVVNKTLDELDFEKIYTNVDKLILDYNCGGQFVVSNIPNTIEELTKHIIEDGKHKHRIGLNVLIMNHNSTSLINDDVVNKIKMMVL